MENATAPTDNQHLTQWVHEMAQLTKPDKIVWLDGSEDEKRRLLEEAEAEGWGDLDNSAVIKVYRRPRL